jgi:hypothetical protein
MAADHLLQLQRFVRFPASSYLVTLRADYEVTNGRKVARAILIPAVEVTSRIRSLGVIYGDFDLGAIVSAKRKLQSEINSSMPDIAFSISVVAQQGYDDNGYVSSQQLLESAPFLFSLTPDGTLSIPESTTCHRTTMIAMLQNSLPRSSMSQSMIQENLVLSDSLPGLDMGARVRMLFPAIVQQEEILSVACEISESLKPKLVFTGASFFRLTRDSMTSTAIRANGLVIRDMQFPYGLDIGVKGTFDRNSFFGPTVVTGNIHCNISASNSALSLAFIPSYRSQTLSIDIVWIGSAWPLFSDIVIETDTRIGSIWTPPKQWLEVSAVLSRIGSEQRSSTLAGLSSNSSEHSLLWKLRESDIMNVVSYVSRSPSADTPFSFALSRGEMNVTIIADSGFWLARNYETSGTVRGPFTMDTSISLVGEKCRVTWVATNGRAIRVTIPSLASWCTGKQKANCNSMLFTISANGITDVALASLANTSDLDSIRTAPSIRRLQTAYELNSGIRPLATTISCPPFCPGGPTYVLEPFVEGNDWASRSNISSARVSAAFSRTSQLVKSTEPGWSVGFSFSDGCEQFGYEAFPAGPEKFSGPCMNESSGAFCSYIQDGVCTPCPLGALCPGHPYIFPKKGYWSAGFPTDPVVEQCSPPSAVRCPGFNISMAVLACGVGYTGLRCASCSEGFYTAFNDSTGDAVCLPCSMTSTGRFLPFLYFCMSLFGLGCALALASWMIARRYGGSIMGSMKRSAKLIMFVFLCAQYLVQVGKATKAAVGIAPAFRIMLRWLEALQFSGLASPPECINSPPFSNELTKMGLMLGALGLSFLCTLVWACVSATGRRIGWKPETLFRAPTKTIGLASRQRLILAATLASIFNVTMFRKLSSLGIAIMFALICNTCLGILKCDTAKPMHVRMYLALAHDGSTLRQANVDCGEIGCSGQAPVSSALMHQLIPVSVVSKYPGFVCGEAEHGVARNVAVITLILMTIYSLVASTALYIRLRKIVRRLSKTGNQEHIILCSCVHRKGLWCIRRQESSVVNEPVQQKDITLFLTRNRSAIGDKEKYSVVNSDVCIKEADADPYFAPLAQKELLPSAFYFTQFNQALALLLSISLTYLDQLHHAWSRLSLNSLTILGLLALLFMIKPYRPSEKFSAHVQTSLLVLSFLVTLTGFMGTLSSPNIRSSSIVANATANATSAVTIIEIRSSRPEMERATSVLSYLTLVLMLVITIFLLFSFFDALKVGAIFEKNVGSSGSKARTVIYSLASIQQIHDKKKHQTIEPSGVQLLPRYNIASPSEKTSIQMAGQLLNASSKNAMQQVVAADKTFGGSFAPVQSRPTSIIVNRNSQRTASGPSPGASRAFSRRNNGDTQISLPSMTLAPMINPFWGASVPRTSMASLSVPRQH